jgi:hypothetical protein
VQLHRLGVGAGQRQRRTLLVFHGTPLHWYQWIIAGFGHREVRQIALRDHLKPSLFNALARMPTRFEEKFLDWPEQWSVTEPYWISDSGEDREVAQFLVQHS